MENSILCVTNGSQASLIVVVVLVFGVVVIRALRIISVSGNMDKPLEGLPDELQERWSHDPVVLGSVGVTAIDAIYHLSQIDSRVLDAIDYSKGSLSFDSYNDLVNQVQDVFGRGPDAVAGLVNLNKGFLGELTITDHLRTQGHFVTMPNIPNEPGVDAWVDGNPVQIKSGLNPAGISTHLEKYPDIPVITVGEHAEVFANEEMVTALPEISGTALESLTENTLEGIDELADVGGDIPIVTAVISGTRNFHRVYKGDSDVLTALEFTASDTIGIGGGIFAGAKAGLIVGGAVGGPWGAAIGSIAGSIGGSIFGRGLSKYWKERGLRDARRRLQTSLAKLPEEYIAGLRTKIGALQIQEQRVKPSGFRSWLWPDQDWVVRSRIANQYKLWAERCRNLQVSLHERAIIAKQSGQEDLALLGQEILQDGFEEPVFTSGLQGLSPQISASIDEVTKELRKHGWDPENDSTS